MLRRRVIVCLDVKDGRVVKGTKFRSLRDIGDPVQLAQAYERAGADEIVFLDISATLEGRRTFLDVVRRTADRVFIPLTVGGGVRSADDVAAALQAGADKVSINTAAVLDPTRLTEAADRFGTQCVVASIDAMREADAWRVHSHGGTRATGLDTLQWARACAGHGAGEILLTSIDRDGSALGYDIELTAAVVATVAVPVVASGGAGRVEDVVTVLSEGQADAALVAGIVHEGTCSIAEIKAAMVAAGIPTRTT